MNKDDEFKEEVKDEDSVWCSSSSSDFFSVEIKHRDDEDLLAFFLCINFVDKKLIKTDKVSILIMQTDQNSIFFFLFGGVCVLMFIPND